MNRILSILLLVVLAACAARPDHTLLRPYKDVPSLKPGTGAVVLGLTAQNFGMALGNSRSGEVLMHFAPLLPPQGDKEFLGTEHYEAQFLCSIFDKKVCRATGGVRVFVLPPGRYAIAGVAAFGVNNDSDRSTNFFEMATYPWIKVIYTPNKAVVGREYSKESLANGDTPTFTVEEGKVTYIGSMVMDFAQPYEMRYWMAADNSAVAELLASPDVSARALIRAPIWGGHSDEKVAWTTKGLY
ncbi:hypothetical protein [Nitrospirillum iridis]|uniref:Lipoprotein n=1 Tax=Nitrospirillum iridis TaxID=765888 RepID=A0A7X0EE17_9PROT|nr:hypothetical protein [Nitrospirillum iridis]MBB6251566.1 hypothetical protein [Nitrospirillum iridis]